MKLFFRDDDFGWKQERSNQLLSIAQKYNVRVNLAAIPQSIALDKNVFNYSNYQKWKDILQIHSHGYSHTSWALEGKKSEYPEGRLRREVQEELFQSRKVVEESFSSLYFPAFTPPWNRISETYLDIVKEAGFLAISRFGIIPQHKRQIYLQEINPSIDLHTAKEVYYSQPEEVIEILEGLEKSDTNEPIGIMLHHNKMTDENFVFLESLFSLIRERSWNTYFFSELMM